MAGETNVTFVGNLAGAPELRFTPNGKPVANFTLVVNHRVKEGNEYKDGEPLFVRVTAWDSLAENIAESLTKGTRVIVQGGFYTRSYETREGEKRSVLELKAEAVGVELRFAVAQPVRQGSTSRATQSADDPWASDSGGGKFGDEPPF